MLSLLKNRFAGKIGAIDKIKVKNIKIKNTSIIHKSKYSKFYSTLEKIYIKI
jgi:hypothetical protein